MNFLTGHLFIGILIGAGGILVYQKYMAKKAAQ